MHRRSALLGCWPDHSSRRVPRLGSFAGRRPCPEEALLELEAFLPFVVVVKRGE